MALTIDELVSVAGADNKARGFHRNDTTFGDRIALIHSEVSEALEAYRDGHLKAWYDHERSYDNYTPKPEGVPSELADILIRVADLAYLEGIDLEIAVLEKLHYNRTRPHRHGKVNL